MRVAGTVGNQFVQVKHDILSFIIHPSPSPDMENHLVVTQRKVVYLTIFGKAIRSKVMPAFVTIVLLIQINVEEYYL